MLKNIYIISWILFQSFAEIICQMVPFKPEERWMHTATLINNKLYILDGLREGVAADEFFYLDFSATFNTQSLSWQNLLGGNIVPPHFGATAVNGGANNNTLFLYGGSDSTAEYPVYTFDPQSNSWSNPKISGASPARKRDLTGIISNNGKMYLWSGFDGTTYQNDMLILDTINLSWEQGSIVGAPTPREFYGATLLPNQKIIYVGGYNNASLPMNEVYLYDITNDNWSTQTTLGKISNRDGFSTVLGLDGQSVIIFGGLNVSSEAALYVLDLTNFSWSIPKVSGQIPNSRADHKANVIGKYMVISFGRGYNQSNESDILLLDISNKNEFKWTNVFELSSTPPSPSSTSSLSLRTSVMIGSIICSITFGFLLAGIIY